MSWRGIFATLMVVLAASVLILGFAASRGFAETYGNDWDLLTTIGGLTAAICAGLLLLARRVQRRDAPASAAVLAIAVLAAAVAVTVGGLVGHRSWEEACDEGRVACG